MEKEVVLMITKSHVHTHHGTKCDEADEGIGRDQTQTDDQGVTECFQVLFIQASVDDEKEDRRNLSRAG